MEAIHLRDEARRMVNVGERNVCVVNCFKNNSGPRDNSQKVPRDKSQKPPKAQNEQKGPKEPKNKEDKPPKEGKPPKGQNSPKPPKDQNSQKNPKELNSPKLPKEGKIPKDQNKQDKPPKEGKPPKDQNSQKPPKDQNKPPREKRDKSLEDCKHFLFGQCKYGDKCYKRHFEPVKTQTKVCFKWEKDQSCTNATCQYRHPKLKEETKDTTPSVTTTTTSVVDEDIVIGYFWDYENCPVGKQADIFDVVKKMRSVNVNSAKEFEFTCFCNISTLSEPVRLALHQANVRLQDIPDKKPNAVDRAIALALTRFQSLHKKATLGKSSQ
jgi:hypothetical protein